MIVIITSCYDSFNIEYFDDLEAAEAWASSYQAKADRGKAEGEILHVFDVKQELTVHKAEVAVVVKLLPAGKA